MEHIRQVLIPIALFTAVLIGIAIILNFILKLRMINSGYKADNLLLTAEERTGKHSALKWGLLTLFGGIGLVIIYYIPDVNKAETALPYGVEAICLAAGFLIYYIIVNKKSES